MLEVSDTEEGLVALHPLGLQNPDVGWSRYRHANPVLTTPLADDLATETSGSV